MKNLIDEFCKCLQLKGYAKTTVSRRAYEIKLLMQYLMTLGIERFEDVSEIVLTGYKHSLFKKGLQPITIEGYTASIFSFYQFLEDNDRIFMSPCVGDFRHTAGRQSNPKILTIAEVNTIISSASDGSKLGVRDKAIFTMLYATGMRRAELFSLTLKSIDLKEMTVRFSGKNNKEALLILTQTAVQELKSYLKVRRKLNTKKSDALWLTRSGKPMKAGNFAHQLKSLTTKTGLDFSCHTIRRSMASHLLANGICPFVLSKHILRHDDIGTLSHYLNTPLNTLIETHDKLNREKVIC